MLTGVRQRPLSVVAGVSRELLQEANLFEPSLTSSTNHHHQYGTVSVGCVRADQAALVAQAVPTPPPGNPPPNSCVPAR